MIYDCCYLFDELDVLEIRLNILDPVVDRFVIVEACKGFQGDAKPFNFEKNSARFAKWQHKIIYHKIVSFDDQGIIEKAYASPSTGGKEHYWLREFYIKESVNIPLQSCKSDDIIFVSDVDEIWNPELSVFKVEEGKVYRPVQDCYAFYVNVRSKQHIGCWTGTRFGTYSTFQKYGGNHFRCEREVQGVLLSNGGWHFSCLTQATKKWDFGHPDDGTRFGIAKRSGLFVDNIGLPRFLIDSRESFQHLFYSEPPVSSLINRSPS